MSEDNWKHRSAGMICGTCMWFAEKDTESHSVGGANDLSTDQSVHFGRCRRHSPSMNGYPAVFGTDWCGDHKLDESKIV